ADAMGSGKLSVRDTNDSLHFTVRMLGNKRENFFSGRVWLGSPLDVNSGVEDSRFQMPGVGTYSSQWAEVIYFLAPGGEQRPPGQPQLFNLYRRQLLLLPDAFSVYDSSVTPPKTIAPTAQTRATVGAGPAFVTNLQDYHRNYDVSAYFDGNYFWFNTP